MSLAQSEWVRTQLAIMTLKLERPLPPPAERWRQICFQVAQSRRFELAFLCVVTLNIIELCTFSYTPEVVGYSATVQAFATIDVTFMIIYVIEMVIKVCGLGLRGYLSKVDNRFDAFIVVTGLLDLLLSLTLRWTEAVRFVRLARIVRILRIMRPLRLMMWTMTIALPALGNVSILFLLGLYVYSAIGVASFWSVGFSPAIVSVANTTTEDDYFYSHDYTNEGNFLNRNANFYDFWHAMLTMIRCMTGENYNGLMHELSGAEYGDNALRCCPTCGPVVDGHALSSCGNTLFARAFFFTYTGLMLFGITSLIQGVFMEAYGQVGSSKPTRVTFERIEQFKEAWRACRAIHETLARQGSEARANKATVAPGQPNSELGTSDAADMRNSETLHSFVAGAELLPSSLLPQLLATVPQPLGLAGLCPPLSRAQQAEFIMQLKLSDRAQGYIHFHETLIALSYRMIGVPVPIGKATRKVEKAARRLPCLPPRSTDGFSLERVFAALCIQAQWRAHRVQVSGRLHNKNAPCASRPTMDQHRNVAVHGTL